MSVMKKCKICGKKFYPVSNRQVYCSCECKNNGRRILENARKDNNKYKKICRICGREFETTTAATSICSSKCNGINISANAEKRIVSNLKTGVKKCSKCGVVKSLGEFYNVKGRPGVSSWCKKCKLDQNKKYAKNPEVAARKKLWKKKYNLGTKDLRKFNRMKNLYGLSFDEYMRMVESQGGKCAICGKKLSGVRGVNIDHCHKTGKVRGLLCRSCNLGLGFFRDNNDILDKAIQYLK